MESEGCGGFVAMQVGRIESRKGVEVGDRTMVLEKYFAAGSGSGLTVLGREKSTQEMGGLKVRGEPLERWDILLIHGSLSG